MLHLLTIYLACLWIIKSVYHVFSWKISMCSTIKMYAIILFMIFVFWVANKQRRVIYYSYNDTRVITPLFINEYRFTYLDSSYIGNVIFKWKLCFCVISLFCIFHECSFPDKSQHISNIECICARGIRCDHPKFLWIKYE